MYRLVNNQGLEVRDFSGGLVKAIPLGPWTIDVAQDSVRISQSLNDKSNNSEDDFFIKKSEVGYIEEDIFDGTMSTLSNYITLSLKNETSLSSTNQLLEKLTGTTVPEQTFTLSLDEMFILDKAGLVFLMHGKGLAPSGKDFSVDLIDFTFLEFTSDTELGVKQKLDVSKMSFVKNYALQAENNFIPDFLVQINPNTTCSIKGRFKFSTNGIKLAEPFTEKIINSDGIDESMLTDTGAFITNEGGAIPLLRTYSGTNGNEIYFAVEERYRITEGFNLIASYSVSDYFSKNIFNTGDKGLINETNKLTELNIQTTQLLHLRNNTTSLKAKILFLTKAEGKALDNSIKRLASSIIEVRNNSIEESVRVDKSSIFKNKKISIVLEGRYTIQENSLSSNQQCTFDFTKAEIELSDIDQACRYNHNCTLITKYQDNFAEEDGNGDFRAAEYIRIMSNTSVNLTIIWLLPNGEYRIAGENGNFVLKT